MNWTVGRRFSALRWKRIRRLIRLFAPYLQKNSGLLTRAAVFGLGAMAMRVLRPWPMKILFDGVLNPHESFTQQKLLRPLMEMPEGALVAACCIALLVISQLWGLFASKQAYLTARAGQQVVHALRRRVHSHLLRLSLGFHQRRKRGDLVMRLTGDINLLRDMLVDALLLTLSEGSVLIAMLVVMTWMDWKLTLVALLVLPLMAATTFTFSVQIREAARKQRRNEGRVAAMVSEMLSSVHLIQAFGREQLQDRLFGKRNRSSLKAGLRTTRLEASMARVVELLLAAGTATVLWVGVHQVRAGALTPGDLLVFVAYLGSTYRPMRRLARVATRMSKAVVCAERVTDVIKSKPDVQDLPGARIAKGTLGAIDFHRVSFTYPAANVRVLKQVSFSVEPGQFIGLVGPSGSGKSTILALMLRLWEPQTGKIRLDGRRLDRYLIQSLRSQIAVVMQEPILFGTTVRENLAFANPQAELAEIERCARLANAHKFISRLPEGYETNLAEAGASLSLGQKQRLSIARAFLRDAPILLLDEPTNGLDASTEREVELALQRLMRHRTTFLIAHKLSSVRLAAQILVVKRGRILEHGTHAELIAHKGWYRRNFRLQKKKAAVKHLRAVPSERDSTSEARIVAAGAGG